jgi:hypothetical protein
METQTSELKPASLYCGPAIVLESHHSSVTVQLPGKDAHAELAVAYPYEPQPNDLVLALGVPDGDLYVVGVLQGKGRTRFCVAGDVYVEATGRLELRGLSGVNIEGQQVSVNADRYQLVARSVVERLGNVCRWAKGAIVTWAGRTRTTVEENATLTAGRIVEKAKRDVVIDGDKIRLG